MAHTSSKPKLTFAFSYGLAGGPIHARQLSRQLRQAGYGPAKQLNKADIIIAHSGGCWLIPETAKPRLVIYVGMPLAQTQLRKTWRSANSGMYQHKSLRRNFEHQFRNFYYILRQPRRNAHMIRIAKAAQPSIFKDCPAVFVANRHDPWLKTDRLQDYVDKYGWAFIGLPGAHDDLYVKSHVECYVSIIDHYARLLAQTNA